MKSEFNFLDEYDNFDQTTKRDLIEPPVQPNYSTARINENCIFGTICFRFIDEIIMPEFHKQTLLINADIPEHCGVQFELDEVSTASSQILSFGNQEKWEYYYDLVLEDNCGYIYECEFDIVDKTWMRNEDRFEKFEADCSPPVKPFGK